MGIVVSKEERAQQNKNKAIENQMAQEKRSESKVLKLLLLGPGESGKSTVLKQMRILHADGFTANDFKAQRTVIHANVLQSMATIIRAMLKLEVKFNDLEREIDAKLVISIVDNNRENDPLTMEVSSALKRLWSDAGVQQCFLRSSEYQLNDSAKYFLDALDRLSAADYVPSQDDILRARVRTTGIVEVQFSLKGLSFRVYDVGGQRSERKKWIHCFDDAHGIMFIVAISEYDQSLFEDETTNRIHESLRLFDSICNSQWFIQTSMLLFLNKKDLFEEKIKKTPITAAFPDYTGDMTAEAAAVYVQQQFENQNQNPEKKIYVHQTCATDTQQIQYILDSAIDIIVQNNLKNCGLY